MKNTIMNFVLMVIVVLGLSIQYGCSPKHGKYYPINDEVGFVQLDDATRIYYVATTIQARALKADSTATFTLNDKEYQWCGFGDHDDIIDLNWYDESENGYEGKSFYITLSPQSAGWKKLGDRYNEQVATLYASDKLAVKYNSYKYWLAIGYQNNASKTVESWMKFGIENYADVMNEKDFKYDPDALAILQEYLANK